MPAITTSAPTRESTPANETRTPSRRASAPVRPSAGATDDEILGLDSRSAGILPANFVDSDAHENRQLEAGATNLAAPDDSSELSSRASSLEASDEGPAVSPALRAALDSNPDLRRAWDDAQAYRETFATPEDARAATAQLADLDRLDALFFSRRAEDHAELARAVAALDPEAFASLARAMQTYAANQASAIPRSEATRNPSSDADGEIPRRPQNGLARDDNTTAPTQAQSDFFHSTNAAAVHGVLDAIETQVDRLLPENISKSARNRVVGEIYRELDATLRGNRQLAQQVRDALRSGSLDAEHQRSIVSLVTGRARQALPGVAKRVLNEWTSTVVAAHNDRRARQQAAERRVDIAGSGRAGNDASRSMAPRDIDYRRMSDSDILNL